jgi:hypothetical protein
MVAIAERKSEHADTEWGTSSERAIVEHEAERQTYGWMTMISGAIEAANVLCFEGALTSDPVIKNHLVYWRRTGDNIGYWSNF